MSYRVIGTGKSRAFRVLWLLEEIGASYGHDPAGPRSDAIRAVVPSGKVPALVVDGAVLTDSTAILTFLADRHGACTHPAGTLERARQDAMTQRTLDEIEGLLWMAARHSFVLPEAERVPQIKDSLRREYAANAAALDAAFAGPFAAGDAFTVADIVLVHCLDWAQAARFRAETPTLDAYRDRVRGRPAYRRARELP